MDTLYQRCSGSALRPYYAKQIGAAKIQGMFSAEGDLKVISGEAPQLVLSEVRNRVERIRRCNPRCSQACRGDS